MKEFLTLIRLLSPINTASGKKSELKLIANGFVRDEFYKVKGQTQQNIDELTFIDSSGTINQVIALKKIDAAYTFEALIKVNHKQKAGKLFLKIQDGDQSKKIKLSKFNLSAKRNCNKTEVYRMKVDEEQLRLSSNVKSDINEEDILFSFIIENLNDEWNLENTLSSFKVQHYKNWEVLIPLTGENQKLADQFKGDKIKFIDTEGYYNTSNRNTLLRKCQGSYIGIIEDLDLLHPHCLSQLYQAITNHKDIKLAYVDSDTIDQKNNRQFPKYRPDLSVDHLRCMNYIGSFYVFAKSCLTEMLGYDKALNLRSSHYDFILRLIDLNQDRNAVKHIDYILYHKSHLNQQSASDKAIISDDNIAITNHLKRNNLNAEVKHSKREGIYEIDYHVEEKKLISILIPFKNESQVLKTCVESVLAKSSYDHYEIILIDHESTEQAVIDYYSKLVNENDHIKCLHYKGEFNYSAINNWAVQFAAGDYYVFLNNDTEVLTAGWLDRMYQYAAQENIGVVGALLLYPDSTIQHDGVYFGYLDKELKYPTSQYINKMQNIGDENAYYPYVVKNVKAVTAACIMVPKEDFVSNGGFDEVRFKVTCNDTDLCFRIGKQKRIVSLPDVILTHYESKSRGLNDTFKKIRLAQRELNLFYDLHKDQFEEKEIIFNV